MSLWTIILHSCPNVPFPFWVNLLNPQPLEGATLQMRILAPGGIAPWAGDGHTPKGNQLVIKAEPNIVTFWEFGIEILRDGMFVAMQKRCWHRESSQQCWPSSQDEGPGTPVAEVPGTVLNPPISEVWWTVFLWRAGKSLGIFILLFDGLGFYSLQANESLPKPMVTPYVMIKLGCVILFSFLSALLKRNCCIFSGGKRQSWRPWENLEKVDCVWWRLGGMTMFLHIWSATIW